MGTSDMLVFALNATRRFGAAVAARLGVPLAAHEEREFEDGEHKARPLVGVRGRDAYVIQSLHGDGGQSVNDKLCRLLFFLATLSDAGASRLTAVVPYLAYARKDRQTKPRDPVTTRYMALLFEAVGADRIIAFEVHNIVAFQNAFRVPTVHLDTRRLFAERALALAGGGALAVASPDPGGVKRAQLFREMLEQMADRPIGAAYMEKRRSAGTVSGNILAGEVEGARVLIIDDMIVGGGTMIRAAEAALEHGATETIALAAHGLFSKGAAARLAASSLSRIIVTDSVILDGAGSTGLPANLEVIGAAPLFAEAIRRCHQDGSIVDLIEGEA
jgi:ribose-phosphate pyrophosphokinase